LVLSVFTCDCLLSTSLPLPFLCFFSIFFFFNDPPTTEIYTLSLHDALPISAKIFPALRRKKTGRSGRSFRSVVFSQPEQHPAPRSEEHTSELQSRFDLVCRLLLEKKKKDEAVAAL